VPYGEVRVIPYEEGQTDTIIVEPAKSFDVGAGRGKSVTVRRFETSKGSRDSTTNLIGGTVGLMIDTRGRPFSVDIATPDRISKLRKTLAAFNLPQPG
jgi:hypothetical protein